jgi:acetolactate synthase-1/2/3 large subunit
MAERPACTLLHLGPGLGNGIANLHNARRASSPVVNIIGEHATTHRHLDAPLTSDIESIARGVSGWVRTSMHATAVASDAAEAVAAAAGPPGQVATLILPADTAWNPALASAPPAPRRAPRAPSDAAVTSVARALRGAKRAALLMNGSALTEKGLAQAGRIAAVTGARLLADTFVPRIARGAGRVDVERVPYFGEQAAEALTGLDLIVTVGSKAPVTFFGYPGKPSEVTPEGCRVIELADALADGADALAALVDALDARNASPTTQPRRRTERPNGPLNPVSIAQALGALLPEHAIVVNEAATSGFAIPQATAGAAPHDWLDLTGGAIGQGLPSATGAAVACPGRRVLALEADGSGMYTLQALWTQAREGLDVTTVIFSNRRYAILQIELLRVGAGNPGRKALDLFDLSRPDLNWVDLAKGMGVPGTRVTTADEFTVALGRSLAAPGPYLIEAVV